MGRQYGVFIAFPGRLPKWQTELMDAYLRNLEPAALEPRRTQSGVPVRSAADFSRVAVNHNGAKAVFIKSATLKSGEFPKILEEAGRLHISILECRNDKHGGRRIVEWTMSAGHPVSATRLLGR